MVLEWDDAVLLRRRTYLRSRIRGKAELRQAPWPRAKPRGSEDAMALVCCVARQTLDHATPQLLTNDVLVNSLSYLNQEPNSQPGSFQFELPVAT